MSKSSDSAAALYLSAETLKELKVQKKKGQTKKVKFGKSINVNLNVKCESPLLLLNSAEVLEEEQLRPSVEESDLFITSLSLWEKEAE